MASKKQKKQESTLTFNKQNALAFADMIYSDSGGMVQFLKLCDGTLSNGKDGGRTLHCAIGEAYFQFVKRDMRSILNKETEKNEDGYEIDYQSEYGASSNGNTGAAIDALVNVAVLKNPNKKRALASALNACVVGNDTGNECGLEAFMERSQEVSETWKKKVVPLLK